MPTLQISFDVKLNPSVQVNDTAWISQEMPGNTLSEPTKLGEIVGVQGNILTVQVDTIVNYLGYIEGFFLLFSKPIHINESGLKGYYADVTFRNSSTSHAELFAISSEAVVSSK